MKPFFSIITPVLNGERFAANYVNCLRQQTWQDWEAIIVDDGSRDKTLETLTKACDSDLRFRILKNDFTGLKCGPASARNKALSAAKGAFICFLDIDDYWLPRKLELQANILSSRSKILTYGSYVRAPLGGRTGTIHDATKLIPQHWLVKFMNPIAIQSKALAVYHTHQNSVSNNKVRSALWTWKCYRSLNYSLTASVLAFTLRGIMQLALLLGEPFRKQVDLQQFISGNVYGLDD